VKHPTALLVAGGAVVVVTLGGCSAGKHAADTVQSAAAVKTDASTCTVYDKAGDVRAEFSGPGIDSVCQNALQTWSKSSGDFYTVTPHEPQERLSTVCVMGSGNATARIDDSGEQIVGQQLCASLVATGWTEDPDAEGAIQASADAAQHQAAEEQAFADQVDAVTRSIVSLQSAVSDFAVDAADLSSDVDETKSAYQDALGDKQGGEDATIVCSDVLYVGTDVDYANTSIDSLRDDASSIGSKVIQLEDDMIVLFDNYSTRADQDTAAGIAATELINTIGATEQGAIEGTNAAIDVANEHLKSVYSWMSKAAALGSCGDDEKADPMNPVKKLTVEADYLTTGD
jgi:hypothetical protein